MAYGQTKYIVKYCQELLNTLEYLRLHRPLIKVLYSGQIWLVDELQKNGIDFNRGLNIHGEYD